MWIPSLSIQTFVRTGRNASSSHAPMPNQNSIGLSTNYVSATRRKTTGSRWSLSFTILGIHLQRAWPRKEST